MKRYRTWQRQQRAAANAKLFPPAAAANIATAANFIAKKS
jgi:hypothetical protein